MAGKRKGPRMIQEIQRLKSLGLGTRAVARALNISRNTVKQYWKSGSENASGKTDAPYHAPWSEDFPWKTVESAVGEGQALAHFWERYRGILPEGDPLLQVPYVSFWREYRRRYPEEERLSFNRTHPPGACCEVDYKGSRPGLGFWDPVRGAFVPCELFGAVLGFSEYLFTDVSLTQQKPDFYRSLDRAFRFFQGVPQILVSDNLAPAVDRADRCDPDLNPDFAACCAHYGVAAIPTRPKKPKDKNLIENSLGLFWRWVKPLLSRHTFSSLAELQEFIARQTEAFNRRVQRRYGLSRRDRFEIERSALSPLPPEPYEICVWKKAKLHWDCHLQAEKNFYSAPFALRGQTLEVRLTARFVAIYRGPDQVAIHPRQPGNQQGRYTTQARHLPPAHQALLEFLPKKLTEEAQAVGPETAAVVTGLFGAGDHPLRYLRRIQGLLRLARQTSPERLEKAIHTARAFGETIPGKKTLEDLLSRPLEAAFPEVPPVVRKPNPYLRGISKTEETP